MKKLAVFILLIILLCCTNLTYTNKLTLKNLFPDSDVEVYVDDIDKDFNLEFIENGTGKILFTTTNEVDSFLHNNNSVLGYTIKIKSTELNEVFKIINVKNVDYVQGAYYGWTNIFDKKLNLDGKNYNFECIEKEEYVLLGVPILLGSY